ncbi:HAMP domain-containing methyl-accepting chemotaxis protein [Halarcobacter anaerophilus]|nr:methyl-accepting chemotaxis protein [Halarcobacter anaerophilus]QDF28811.1 4HB sensor-containing MCP-domain signal transduction protein [Halarcobacter anaerophilus]
MSIQNLKMRTKIFLIVLLGIIGLVVVVIPTILELNSTVDRLDKADELSRLDRRFADMRRQEKNFMLRKDAQSLQKHKELYEESIKIINQLSNRFKNPKNIEMISEIKSHIEYYRKEFALYVSNHKDSIVSKYDLTNEETNMVTNARKVSSLVTDFRRAQSKEANEDIDSLKTFIISIGLLALILLSFFAGLIVSSIIKSLEEVKAGLLSFFSFLNKESSSVKAINLNSQDEFGQMAKVINENIVKTKKVIDEDNEVIADAKVVMQRVKNGWYSQFIEKHTSNESLDEFKNGVNEMIKSTRERFQELEDVLALYAKLDYRKTLKMRENDEKGGVLEKFVIGINTLQTSITQMLVENKQNGLTLDKSSDILLENVEILNTNSNEAAAALEETAAALEEITSNIVSNTDNVVKMGNYANELTQSAKEGEKLAQETTVSMDEINEQVNSINEAITVIDQIAFQTNILSLNAAVEAATAGEAGKGFAVVAQEVRNLAARSAEAAKEIKDLVETATTKANSGKSIADKMIKGYNGLNDNISKTIEIISDVEMASKEQQTGIEQINDAVTQLDQQTQQNAAIASQTHEVAIQTDEISKMVVSSANEKEFEGKNSVKASEIRGEKNRNNDKKTPSSPSSKKVTKIAEKKLTSSDKEVWESF